MILFYKPNWLSIQKNVSRTDVLSAVELTSRPSACFKQHVVFVTFKLTVFVVCNMYKIEGVRASIRGKQ